MQTILAYPGNSWHAQNAALALLEVGSLQTFLTGYRFDRNGALASFVRRAPFGLAETLERQLGRRAVDAEHHRTIVGRPEDVHAVVKARLAGLQQEVFLAVGVDIRNGLLDVVEVARGTVNGVEVHPREVFRPLIRMAAAGAVLVHNHPSGDPTPSSHDVDLTRRLRVVGDVLGIPVIDHVVVGDASFRSIAEWLGPEL